VLRAVNILGDLYELSGCGVREFRILLGHAFDDVGLQVSLVHQLTRALADSDGVRSGFVGDAGIVESSQKVPVRVGLGGRCQGDRRAETRKHHEQSHGFIVVQIGAVDKDNAGDGSRERVLKVKKGSG
jgi:hypothetical protein